MTTTEVSVVKDAEPEKITQAFTIPDDTHISVIKQMVALTTEQESRIASILWLRGYTMAEIASQLNKSTRDVVEIIKEQRTEIAEWHRDEIDSLRAERIEALRQVIRRLWSEYEGPDKPKAGIKIQILANIARIEETIAKMQGVVENKHVHVGDVEHFHKIYDFQPTNYPDAVDGEVKELPRGKD